MKVETRKRREGGQLTHKGKKYRTILPKNEWFQFRLDYCQTLNHEHSLCLTLTFTFSHFFWFGLKSKYLFSLSLILLRISREVSNFILSRCQ